MIENAGAILIVFTTHAQLPAWVEKWARFRHAPVLCSIATAQALQEVVRRRPDAVVVYLANPAQLEASARMLVELRRRRPQVLRVALSEAPNEEFERCARSAGAHLYFSSSQDLDALDASLSGLRSNSDRRPRPPPRGARDWLHKRPPPVRLRRRVSRSFSNLHEENEP